MIVRLLATIVLLFQIQASDELLAAVLILEAGGERNEKAMPAVWEVIKNRSKATKLEPYQVVKKPLQFSCLNHITDEQAIKKAKKHFKWGRAIEIVKKNESTNYTKGANHYYSIIIKPPKWAEEKKFTVKIGKHKFYKL